MYDSHYISYVYEMYMSMDTFHTYNVYIYFLIMEQNTFTNNYGGYELGVVTIMGAHFF